MAGGKSSRRAKMRKRDDVSSYQRIWGVFRLEKYSEILLPVVQAVQE
jgi:hypothetical protein